MKRQIENENSVALPTEIWEEIISASYIEEKRTLLVIAQLNKWFYKLVDVKWHAEIDELRDDVIIARLNAKYSALDEWFICDECRKLYRSDKDHSHLDVDDNFKGVNICWPCIKSCEYCDQTYLASSANKHSQCGQDAYAYEDESYEYSSRHHSDEDLSEPLLKSYSF